MKLYHRFYSNKKVIFHLRAEMSEEPPKSNGEAGMSNTDAHTAKGVLVLLDNLEQFDHARLSSSDVP